MTSQVSEVTVTSSRSVIITSSAVNSQLRTRAVSEIPGYSQWSRMDVLRSGCVVEVSGSDKRHTGSTSGVLIDPRTGYVLTHSTLLYPFLAHDNRTLRSLLTKSSLNDKWFSKLPITLVFERNFCRQTEVSSGRKYSTALVNVNLSSSRDSMTPQLSRYHGDIKYVWKAPNFAQTLLKLFPGSEKWKFYDEMVENDIKETLQTKKKKSNQLETAAVAQLLPYFVLIKIHNWSPIEVTPTSITDNIHVGQSVVAMGTPFANLSPEVFLNSTSRGVISQIAGTRRETILTDARCIPGSEGGAVFSNDRQLIGMIVAPLCWKANEWIGLSVVVSMAEVIGSLCQSLSTSSLDFHEKLLPLSDLSSCSTAHLLDSVPVLLVQARGLWGSGVVVSTSPGVILTCSHLVNKATSVQVRYDTALSHHWCQAEVIYSTPEGAVFDIAVLCFDSNDLPHITVPAIQHHPTQGDPVCAVGHALFGREHKMRASLTRGTISKVICVDDIPVMIQSTCVVLPGSSGGPLVTEDGNLVAIMTCNAKDTESGASYPHINLCVPITSIWGPLQQYILSECKDVAALSSLHLSNENVERMWSLQGSRDVPSQSKL